MRIVFFNHKGGVSKTTTTFHLGWKLAERGSRVLLVDADPQCNLTGLIMQDNFEAYYENPSTAQQNLMDGVATAFTGQIEPIQPITCYNIPRNPNLFLLPGHPNLTELEPQLSFVQTTKNAFATMQNLPGAFNALIERTCDKYHIDYVLIDLNPGLSAINENLFSISDMFIIPTNPDPFSLMAVITLAKVLPRWASNATDMHRTFSAAAYPFPSRNPKFGGLIIQRFNIRNGQPARPFRNNMDDILEKVETVLVPSLSGARMTYAATVYDSAGIHPNYCIAEIPDFQSLLPQSHMVGVPVFALNNNEMERTGSVLAQMIDKRDTFNSMFDGFAAKVEALKANG